MGNFIACIKAADSQKFKFQFVELRPLNQRLFYVSTKGLDGLPLCFQMHFRDGLWKILDPSTVASRILDLETALQKAISDEKFLDRYFWRRVQDRNEPVYFLGSLMTFNAKSALPHDVIMNK